MTAIEHKELKGITLKNMIVTVASTASIVASVMTTYFGLKNDILDIRNQQTTEARINNIRLQMLESEVSLLQKEIGQLKTTDAPVSPASSLINTGTRRVFKPLRHKTASINYLTKNIQP